MVYTDPGGCPHTKLIVKTINEATGVAEKRQPGVRGQCPFSGLTPAATKETYYALLLPVLPEIMGIVREQRDTFELGLVSRTEKPGQLTSALTADFLSKMRSYTTSGDFLKASYWVHCAIFNSIDIATEEWFNRRAGEPVTKDLNLLTDEKRREMYGALAAQKRISSAANQAVFISASFEAFSFDKHVAATREVPTPESIETYHTGSLQTALQLTDLHLNHTRVIRQLLGAAALDGGPVELYQNSKDFALTPEGIMILPSLAENLLKAGVQIDVADGRIGCPGKALVPVIWQWIHEVSRVLSYPALLPENQARSASPYASRADNQQSLIAC
jgi:hypothetical protein